MSFPTPDLQTEEKAEIRSISDYPQIPDLPASALRARLLRALPLLEASPEEALAILAAPSSPSGLADA